MTASAGGYGNEMKRYPFIQMIHFLETVMGGRGRGGRDGGDRGGGRKQGRKHRTQTQDANTGRKHRTQTQDANTGRRVGMRNGKGLASRGGAVRSCQVSSSAHLSHCIADKARIPALPPKTAKGTGAKAALRHNEVFDSVEGTVLVSGCGGEPEGRPSTRTFHHLHQTCGQSPRR